MPAPPPDAERMSPEVTERLVSETVSMIRPATWAFTGTAVMLGGASLSFARPWRVLAWVALVSFSHLALFAIVSREAEIRTHRLPSQRKYRFALGIIGAIWGSMPWIVQSTTDGGWLLLALALTVVMVAAGSVGSRTINTKASFQGALLIVGASGLIAHAGGPGLGAALLMCASFIVDQWTAIIGRRTILSTIEASLENERLAAELREANAELSHAAVHDALTKLPNRTQVDQAITSGAGSSGTVCVGFLDLDRFKYVNDSHGHPSGDQLLIDVAERLKATLRPRDFVSRAGGDEFVLVLCDTTTDAQAAAGAERVLRAFEAPFHIGGRRQRVTASLGLAVGPAIEATQLLRFADNALYEAKKRGRDRFHIFDDDLRERAQAQVRVEQDLRTALERGDVTGWFQPIVDLETGQYLGVECLARWVGSDFDDTAEFMPLAVGLGLVVPVTKKAIEAIEPVLRNFASRVSSDGRLEAPRLAINVPPLHAAEIIAHTRQQLGDALFPCLTFELTETEMMGDLSEVVAAIEVARSLGAHVVLDDFGTAYSALSLVVELPIDGVKIDQSFVSDIETDNVSQAIVSGVVQVSRHLGISVIAEGVETAGQAEALRRLGVRRAQGFLFSRAVPVDQAVLDADRTDWPVT